MKPVMLTLFTLFFLSLTAACNTMGGLGRDIERGGQKLEESAEKNKHSSNTR